MTNDSAVGLTSAQSAPAPRAAGGHASSLGAALLRHLPLVLTCAVVGAALGGGIALSRPVTYSSDSVVLVNPVVGAPFSPTSRGATANLETEAQLVSTPAVAAYVEKALSDDGDSVSVEDLRRAVTAVVPSSTQLLRITATADSPAEAQRRAGAYATAFLSYRADRADEVAARQLKTISEQRAGLEKQLSDTTARLAASGVSAGEKGLLTERSDLITQQLSRLDEQASRLADVGASPGQVVTPSTAPGRARAGAVGLFAGAGSVLGLLVGMVLALLRDRRDDRIHGTGELDGSDLPLLAQLPAVAESDAPVTLTAPDSPAAQAVRRLRTAVLVAPGGAPRSVAVSGVGSTPAAAVAADLAVSLARTGERTVLVDADLSAGGKLSRLLGVQPGPGLSEALLERRSVLPLVQPTVLGPLTVLASGTGEGASDRFLTEDMRHSLTDLAAGGARLVVSAAPATSADGEAVDALTEAVVLVVQTGHTTWAQLDAAHRELTRLGARVLGVVSVAQPQRKTRRSGLSRAGARLRGTSSKAGGSTQARAAGGAVASPATGDEAAAGHRVSARR